jgi:hypothetical protein
LYDDELGELYDNINEDDIDPNTEKYIKFPKLIEKLKNADNFNCSELEKQKIKKKIVKIYLGSLIE